MTTAFVYLLRSVKDGSSYVGWTTDLRRRLEEHNAGKTPDTQTRGPWKLVAYETYEDSEAAQQRERNLKRNPRMLSLFKKWAINVFRTASGGPRQVVG